MIHYSSRQLRAMLLVAHHHSFTRAAEALFMSPSALSLSIRELEQQLGFRVFERTTRHVALTAEGRALVAVARRSVDDLDDAMTRIQRTAREADDRLSVGAGLLMSANVLPPAIREFRDQRPDVRISLYDADPITLMQKVKAGTLDIGLGFFKRTAGIERTLFFRFSLIAVAAESGAAARGAMTWSALKGERLVLQSSPTPVRQLIDRQLAAAGASPRAAVVLNRLETVIAMAEAGEGIGIVPSFTLPVCRRRRVITSRLVNPSVPVDLYQIRSRGRKLSPAADDFGRFLHAYIARWAGRSIPNS
ncbi:MAG TPA: LysR family transcriptional regulator [Vicinamibacterales bacterium]|jgi:DNA-binding transcriptional LysR family regulator